MNLITKDNLKINGEILDLNSNNNVFTSIPFVFVNLVRDDKEFSILSIYNVTTTGFKLSLYYAGGDCQVQYIAFTLKD